MRVPGCHQDFTVIERRYCGIAPPQVFTTSYSTKTWPNSTHEALFESLHLINFIIQYSVPSLRGHRQPTREVSTPSTHLATPYFRATKHFIHHAMQDLRAHHPVWFSIVRLSLPLMGALVLPHCFPEPGPVTSVSSTQCGTQKLLPLSCLGCFSN
jgi:hypothetical protein